MAPPTRQVYVPAYASLPEDGFAPWPLDPCAKRPRLDVTCARQEWPRVSSEDIGQPWVEATDPYSIALATAGSRLKQQREWHQELQPKRRRLLKDFILPIPLSGPRPLEPGQNLNEALEGPSAFEWGDLSCLGDSAMDRGAGEDDTPTCTAVVPYREPLGFWAWVQGNGDPAIPVASSGPRTAEARAEARQCRREPSSLPIPRTPALPLQVAEVAVQGETVAVLPEIAAQHRGKPGAEEQLIPWRKDLAIVLYRGPGCNIEPDPRPASDVASMEVV